jgi:hypothetical protein
LDFVKKLLLGPNYDAWPPKGAIRTWPVGDEFTAKVAAIAFEPRGDDSVAVVGTDACRELIEPIVAGRRASRDPNTEHMAFLIPEPSNAEDPDAVRVIVGSSKPGGPAGKVGYLSHDDAGAYRPVIDRLALRGRVVACRAVIEEAVAPAATDAVADARAGAAVSYTVRLRLAAPAALLGELGRDG